jgi:signal peptidase II
VKALSIGKFYSFFIAALIFLFDQLSKHYIKSSINIYEKIKISTYLNIVHIKNKGIAFGIFNNNADILFYMVLSVAIIVSIFLLHYIFTNKDSISNLSASLVLGGACGNIFDKIIDGSVTDFIDIHINHWHWPAFNLADSSICLGAFIYILYNKTAAKSSRYVYKDN